jgi:outer membrane protein OmpA-like peptidoglycan-associated protein
MKKYLFIFSIAALATAASTNAQTSPATDGSAMKAEDIAKQWQKAPASAAGAPGLPAGMRTRGIVTRGAAPSQPQTRTRGAALSQHAVEANAAALDNLRSRGVKILHGFEAAAAQAAQDQSIGVATAPQPQVGSPSNTPPPAFVQVPVVPEKQIAFRLRFKLDSTELADAESDGLVTSIAKAMKELPDSVFLLEGHTCDLGESAHNQSLSEARALRVRTLLGDLGIPSSRLLSVGLGESQSEVPNTSESNRALNRRVVIGPIELSPQH